MLDGLSMLKGMTENIKKNKNEDGNILNGILMLKKGRKKNKTASKAEKLAFRAS